MLTGTDETLRREALALLLRLATQGDDFDSEVVQADAKPVHEWVATAGTSPFLSERRTVVVRNLLRVDPKESRPAGKKAEHPFAQGLKSLPPTALLILVADEESGDEAKQRRLDTVRKAWAAVVESGGGKVYEFSVDPKAVPQMLREEAKAHGKRLSASAATLLAEMTGARYGQALQELHKLCLYVGDALDVLEADIKKAVAPDREYNVFALIDAIVEGDSGKALTQLRRLFDKADQVESEAYPRVFPLLARQFRLVWQARLCLEEGCSLSAVPDPVRALMPKSPSLIAEREWSQSRAMRAARRIDLTQLSIVFRELAEADAKMKGILPGYTPIDTLETMTLRMARACGSANG